MLVVVTETYCNKVNIQITQRDGFIPINSSSNSHQLFCIDIDSYPNAKLYLHLFTFYMFQSFHSTINK